MGLWPGAWEMSLPLCSVLAWGKPWTRLIPAVPQVLRSTWEVYYIPVHLGMALVGPESPAERGPAYYSFIDLARYLLSTYYVPGAFQVLRTKQRTQETNFLPPSPQVRRRRPSPRALLHSHSQLRSLPLTCRVVCVMISLSGVCVCRV